MKKEGAIVEVYQGVIKHYLVFPDGERVQMENPVAAEVHMPYMSGGGVVPNCLPSYCVNNILDMMKAKIMERYNEL